MLTDLQHARIVNGFTSFDRRASTRKGYNPYALAMYCAAIDNVKEYMAAGYTLRQAVIKSYLGRLCDAILKELGEAKMTNEEAKFGVRL